MTKRLACTVIVASATLAHADEVSLLEKALDSPAAVKTMFADSVSIGPILFAESKCIAQFGSPGKVAGADRDALAGCLHDLRLLAVHDTSPQQWQGSNGAVVTFTLAIARSSRFDRRPRSKARRRRPPRACCSTPVFRPSLAVRATIDRTEAVCRVDVRHRHRWRSRAGGSARVA
jgi:hypothetical protein